MTWAARAHAGFSRELRALPIDDRERIKKRLAKLVLWLGTREHAPRNVALSKPLAGQPDLRPLAGTGIPGSYRLRVGDLRVALVLLPAERVVLVTTIVRRSDAAYRRIGRRHARRFRDR